MLVGSTLMRAPDPGAKLRELLSRPLVKVCGLTRQEDVDAAVEAGADLVGFILAQEPAPRAHGARRAEYGAVGRRASSGHGQPGRRPRPALPGGRGTVRGATAGSCGAASPSGRSSTCRGRQTTPEPLARRRGARPGRVVLAGGLGPGNVRAAIEAVHPWAVDSASSTETEPGIKDHARVRAWVGGTRMTTPVRRLRRPLRPRDTDPGARRAHRGLGDRERRRRVPGTSCTSSRRRTPAAPRRSRSRNASTRQARLPQARGPPPHRRAQAQQRARPGRARAPARQEADRRRDRRGPARRRDGHGLRALRARLRRLHGRRGHAPPGPNVERMHLLGAEVAPSSSARRR